MNYPEITAILEEMYELIDEQTITTSTIFDSPEELEDDLLNYIDDLKDNSGSWIPHLDIHFKNGGTFEVIANQNNWSLFPEWQSRFFAAKQ